MDKPKVVYTAILIIFIYSSDFYKGTILFEDLNWSYFWPFTRDLIFLFEVI